MEKYVPNKNVRQALDKVAAVLNMKSVAMAQDGEEFIVYDKVSGGIAFTLTVDESKLAEQLEDKASTISFDDDYPDFDPNSVTSYCYLD